MISKNQIITLLFFLLALMAKGQNSGFYWNNLNENSNRLQGKITGEIYYLNAAEGKYHFFHDEWYNGSVVLTDGDIFDHIRLRYMSFKDQLIAYNDANRSLFIVDKDIVAAFYIDTEKLKQKFVRLEYDGIAKGSGYFQELYNGTRSLLVYHTIKQKKTRPYKNELGILSDIEYEKDRTYYLYSNSTGFKRLRINRQSFYNAFPNQKKEIKKIIRKNKLSEKSEISFIQTIRDMDQLGILD